MICELIHEERSAADKRYRVDAFAGIADPLNIDGYEINMFEAMKRAMFRMPTYPEGTHFRLDDAAYELMMRQAQLDPNALLRATPGEPFKFRSLPVNRVGTST